MITYQVLPIIGNCCITVPEEEQLFIDYSEQIISCTDAALNKAYARELFGYDSEPYFNQVNNVYYLFDILLWIYRDWKLHPEKTREDYYAQFNIDCWKRTFMCCGCDITNALRVFGLEDPVFVSSIIVKRKEVDKKE